jgi:hypothetical protein
MHHFEFVLLRNAFVFCMCTEAEVVTWLSTENHPDLYKRVLNDFIYCVV